MEYKIGDYLVHESSGVCQITDIEMMEMMGKGSARNYYIMTPVYKAGAKVFTPVDATGIGVKLRPVASPETMRHILDNVCELPIIDETNERIRADKIKDMLAIFTPESLAIVVKTVLNRKWERIASGKKVMAADEKMISMAGKKLYEEMAFSLNLPVEEIQKSFEGSVRSGIMVNS